MITSMTGFIIIPALLIITVMIMGLLLVRRLSGRPAGFRPSTGRSPFVRIVCAVLGGGILVTVAIASWHDAHGPYRTADACAALTQKASPSPHPTADLDLDAVPGLRKPMVSARFLLRVFIGPATPAGFSACYRQEWDVRWSGQEQPAFTGAWSGDGAQVEYSFTLRDLMDAQITDRKGRIQQILIGNGDFRCDYRMGLTQGCVEEGFGLSEAGHVIDLGRGSQAAGRPFSITPPSAGSLILFATLTPLQEAETLAEQPVVGFLAAYQERLMARTQRSDFDRGQHIPMRGLALAAHLGLVTLLLLTAAFLLTQCFRNRQLALAGALFGVVLFVAALDRVVVGVHLQRLGDPQASIEQRLLAGHCLRGSFFHRVTAWRHVQAIMTDAKSPESLRTALARVAPSP